MDMREHTTAIGVFPTKAQAQQAVKALKEGGFTDEQVGFLAPGDDQMALDQATESHMGEGTILGAAGGAGVGALWALGIASGMLPAIGPAVAGGILMSLIASAGGGAAVGTVIGALVGLGVPAEHAAHYEKELQSGRTLVAVRAPGRTQEAETILRQYGGILSLADIPETAVSGF